VSRNGNTFKQFTDLCTRITERYGGTAPSSMVRSSARTATVARCSMFCSADADSHVSLPSIYFTWTASIFVDARSWSARPRYATSSRRAGRSRTWTMLRTMGALFEEIFRRDLEGIVAKCWRGPYDPDAARWYKVKTRHTRSSRGVGDASAAARRGGGINQFECGHYEGQQAFWERARRPLRRAHLQANTFDRYATTPNTFSASR
jgi:hypothetical protein